MQDFNFSCWIYIWNKKTVRCKFAHILRLFKANTAYCGRNKMNEISFKILDLNACWFRIIDTIFNSHVNPSLYVFYISLCSTHVCCFYTVKFVNVIDSALCCVTLAFLILDDDCKSCKLLIWSITLQEKAN